MMFDPNQVTFAEGAVRVQGVLARLKIDTSKAIMTSRDPVAKRLRELLPVSNVPKGFSKYQLPFVMSDSQLFVTFASPNAEVAEHSHDEGDGIRFIADGSVIYKDIELTAGDWMFIPKGVKYAIRMGARGAVMCYCYCCSCAGRADLRHWIVDPAPMD